MWIESSAPSNIALIKYMGKQDAGLNRPTNSSLSYSLQKLKTYVRLMQDANLTNDEWAPYERSDLRPIVLTEKGKEKFLRHFQELKKEFKLTGFFKIESANNFPADCGLASSASSFAALTLAAHEYMIKTSSGQPMPYRAKELAKISQKGSGSSCRSFFEQWSLWHQSGSAEAIDLPFTHLRHQVILCDETVKKVSSSEAHQRVLTSDLFKGRAERAEDRLQKLVQCLREKNWQRAFNISWNEFWDMHLLFHTSNPSFMYMSGQAVEALKWLNQFWQEKQEGPLVTMDAGSNIHLLYQEGQQEIYQFVFESLKNHFSFWTDEGYFGKD